MQYNQSLYGSGYPTPSCGPYYPYNPTSPYTTQCPEVIGEGDVTPVVLPNGTTQLYFLPTKLCPQLLFNHNFGNCNNLYWNSNSGVYFIRSVSNPIPYPMFQQNPIPYGALFEKPSCYACSFTSPGYPIKFHNDSWTSTTDLRYFFPRFHTSGALPRECAAVQVSVPMETRTIEMVCNKPCLCASGCCGTKTETAACNERPETKDTKSSPSHEKEEEKREHECTKTKEARKTCKCVTSRSENSESSCKSCMSVEGSISKGKTSKKKAKKDQRHRNRYCDCYTTDSEKTGSSCMSIDGTNKKGRKAKKVKGKDSGSTFCSYDSDTEAVSHETASKRKPSNKKSNRKNKYNCESCTGSDTTDIVTKSKATTKTKRNRVTKSTASTSTRSEPNKSKGKLYKTEKNSVDKTTGRTRNCMSIADTEPDRNFKKASVNRKQGPEDSSEREINITSNFCSGTHDTKLERASALPDGPSVINETTDCFALRRPQASSCNSPYKLASWFPKPPVDTNFSTNDKSEDDLCVCCNNSEKSTAEKKDYNCECSLPGPDPLNKVVATVDVGERHSNGIRWESHTS